MERLKSVSRAAEAVYLSQPAVTQAIAKLESLFGVVLFERLGNGVTPTAAATAYALRARRALSFIELGVGESARIGGKLGARAGKDLLPLLTMTQVRAFVAVGSRNSFTLAARQVGSSQPSVHRTIREFESIIGVSLFEKTTLGLSLTRAGKFLWQQLKLAFSELQQGISDIRASEGETVGAIVVGCLPLARHHVIPQAINAFASAHPQTEIHLVDSPYPDLLHGLRHGDIDFLIGALRNPVPTGDVVQEPIFAATLCIAARRGHPLALAKHVDIGELAAFPWVLPPTGTPTRERFERFMGSLSNEAIHGLVEASSQILVRELLITSDRLTLISRQQVQFEMDVGELVALDFDLGDTRRDIGLTFRANWKPTEIQRSFLRYVREIGRGYTEA